MLTIAATAGELKSMGLAGKFASHLPARVKNRVKRVRDVARFRRLGLVTKYYNGPLEFLGTPYGGYVLPSQEIAAGAVCYSFGAGEDVSFETELAICYPVEVHIFDPTPRAVTYMRSLLDRLAATGAPAGRRLAFHPWGVWSSDCPMEFYAPKNPAHVSHSVVNMQHTKQYFTADCRRPRSIMNALGHSRLGLVKLNIEGAEYEVVRSMFEDDIRPSILCINFDELHTEVDAQAQERLRGLVKKFADQGYVPVSAEACRVTFVLSQ